MPKEKDLVNYLKGEWGHQSWCACYINRTGCAIYEDGRRVHHGLTKKGSSDVIINGSVLITPEMVGKTIGRFGALELKKPGEKPTETQYDFLDVTRKHGGHAGWADSPDAVDHFFQTFHIL